MQTKQKKPTIVVGINSLTSSKYLAYSNHIQLMYRLGRSYRKYDFILVNPPRMSIDRMRNLCAKVALENEAKYLLFIDDDVLIPYPFDFLNKLIACKAPIAAADVLIRGYPFHHMLFKYTKDKLGLNPMPNVPKELGQIPVDAVGFSCCLIEVSLLKQLTFPFFVTGLNNTEDIYFCVKVRSKFPQLKMIADTSIKCAHILGDEVIEPDNKPAYKAYWEKLNGKPEKQSGDRGEPYYKIVGGLFDEA